MNLSMAKGTPPGSRAPKSPWFRVLSASSMPSMRWSLLVPIEKVCPSRKLCAGSTRRVALNSTLLSSGPSFLSRKQRFPPCSPPLARPSPPLCKPVTQPPVGRIWVVGSLPPFLGAQHVAPLLSRTAKLRDVLLGFWTTSIIQTSALQPPSDLN